MELNREQIIKALECCSSKIGCKECPLKPRESVSICITQISKYALSLIKELTEENERLSKDNAYLIREAIFSPMERANNTLAVRADTVREMRERIAEHATNWYPRKVRLDVIDQIAKEMLEGIE